MEYEITEKEFRVIKTICKFLDNCSPSAKAIILNEILMLNSIIVFNPSTKSLDNVESVAGLNGKSIQLNLEE